jgi:signal transduction histidine kinase
VFLPRGGLQRRIMVYVSLGLLVLCGFFGALTWHAVQQSSELIKEQRLSFARALAIHVDGTLHRALVELHGASVTLGLLSDHPGTPALYLARLREQLGQHGVEVAGCLAVLNASGEVRWSEAGTSPAACVPSAPLELAQRALAIGGLVSEARAMPDVERPLIAAAIPIGGLTGSHTGVLVAGIRPILRSADVRSLLDRASPDWSYRIEIIAAGRVVDTSADQPSDAAEAHWQLIAPLLREGRAGLVEHREDASQRISRDYRRHYIAFVPLRTAPWVLVAEPRHDLAMALPRTVRNQMLATGGLGLAAALTLAWITTRQVIRPLSELTVAAQRITGGDLGQAIQPSGHDEVHSLTIALEVMRARLQALLQEREQWGRVLERQVAVRTRELEQRNSELVVAGEENLRLYEQVSEKEQQRRRLLERIMLAYEEERKRIARGLHDEVGQALTGLIVTLDSIMAGGAPSRDREALQGLRDLTNVTLKEVRRIIAALRPSLLDDLGLLPALQSCAKSALGAAGVAYRVEASPLIERLPAMVETALFRIGQEAITNVVRHARARHVAIHLHTSPARAQIMVEDDGAGFDPDGIANGTGGVMMGSVGLSGMRERAELLGGQLEVASAPGQGTRVRACIPIAEGTVAEGTLSAFGKVA